MRRTHFKQRERRVTSPRRSPLRFFALVVALTIPFWALSALNGTQIIPGVPIAGLAAFCPAAASLLLVGHDEGGPAARDMLLGALDVRRITPKVWWLPMALLMPTVDLMAFFVMRWTGTRVPAPPVEVSRTLVLAGGFLLGALGEELGWSGYAIDPMQRRLGVVPASLALGAFWAAYHYPAFVVIHRPILWVAWWTLGTVAARVLVVWVYNGTGRSVLAAALFHMSSNLAWQTFPIHGSYFDPRVHGILATVVAVIIVVRGAARPRSRRM